jgi:glycosyltransferase involved in cell wall biosynthesis
VRLVIDLQGAQGANAVRGIGRYSRELALAMAKAPRNHDILLALNGSMTETAEELTASFSRLLPKRQIRPWFTSASGAELGLSGKASRIIRAQFLASLRPDLVHVASVFEGLGDRGVTFSPSNLERLPMVGTIYDLIPLIRRQDYLEFGGVLHQHQRWYYKGLHELSLMDGLLAISESSRQEALGHLGFSHDRVFNVQAGINPDFHPPRLDVAARDALLHRYGLRRGKFILFVGAGDVRKNEAGLLDAYTQLPVELRQEHQLVVVGHVAEAALRQILQASDISIDRLVLLPFVVEKDLALLYGECSLFVFPSLHEGFGLPPAEAMACGAPVIASNTSSLPEVMDCPSALFDPTRPSEIATLITKVLRDSEFRECLIEHGKRQASRFTWEKCAERAWDALENLYDRRNCTKQKASGVLARLPSLAFVSPLPPDATGIADFSRALLPALARHYDITLVSQRNEVGDPWLAAVFPGLSAADFCVTASEFDRILYQLGCSDFHLFQYRDLMPSHPGVSVLHDAFLSNLWNWVAHHNGRPEGFLLDLYVSHGYASVAFEIKHGRDAAVRHFPCSLQILENSFATILHSEFAASLLSKFFGPMVHDVTHIIPLLAHARPRLDQSKARLTLGLDRDELIICTFGLVSPAKLPHGLLEAWRSVRGNRGRLVFVGAKVDGLADFPDEQDDVGMVQVTGRVNQITYDTWLSAADIAVQLRTDSRGETSGAMVDCLYFGVPLIISDHGSAAEVPGHCVVKLSDPFKPEELRNAIERLRDCAEVRKDLSAAAMKFVGDQLHASRIANMYYEAIETAYHRRLLPSSLTVTEDIAQSPDAYSTLDGSLTEVSTAIARTFRTYSPGSRLLVDMSELARRDSRSGIQRVVREVGLRLLRGLDGVHRTEAVRFERGQLRQAHDLACKLLDCRPFWGEEAPLDYGEEDILLCLDLNPHMTEAEFCDLRRRKLAGMRLVLVVYDLLPMLHPDWFPEGIKVVSAWYARMLSLADHAVCISRAVADELIAWLHRSPTVRTTKPLPIDFFHLAGDFSGSGDDRQPDTVLLAAIAAAARRPTFVMVGTLEPRKGYLQTLAAFEQLWADREDVGLVIVGKTGWHMEDFSQRLRSHVQLGTKLHWLERASDPDLRRLYSVGTCLLMASEGEGFGLPIVEAAEAGLPILAREIPVFREIAGQQALYFSGLTPEALATAILSWLEFRKRGTVPRSQEVNTQTWDSSVRQILDRLQSIQPYHLWVPDTETLSERPNNPIVPSKS